MIQRIPPFSRHPVQKSLRDSWELLREDIIFLFLSKDLKKINFPISTPQL